MASFFSKLFGGGTPEPAKPVEETEATLAAIGNCQEA